jgi:dihydroxyacetone kinase-like predicted kinase
VHSIDVALEGREAGSIRAEGYLDGELAVVLDDPIRAAERLLSQVDTKSVEVVTIYVGAAADASLIARAEEAVRRSVPRATVAAVPGGQARPLLILSLE